MKFAIESEHRDYFRIHRHIEFEDLLNEQQLVDIVNGVEAAIEARLNIPLYKVSSLPPHSLFMAGRDLWRINDKVRKIATNPNFASLAAQLMEQKQIRLGYDQLFPETRHLFAAYAIPDVYSSFLRKKASLNDVSSLNRIVCGLMLCISGAGGEPLPLFSAKRGSGVFIDPELPLDFSQLKERPGHRYLLIVYVPQTTQYIINEKDPNTYALKHLGYGIGDALRDKLNPLLFR